MPQHVGPIRVDPPHTSTPRRRLSPTAS